MARSIARILLAVLAALILLWVALWFFGVPGGVATALLVIPVAAYFLPSGHRWRWLELGVLVDAYCLCLLLGDSATGAGLLGGIIATGAALLVTAIVLVLCSEVTLVPQGQDRVPALWVLVRLIIGLFRPFQLIQGGKIVQPEGGGRVYGPSLLVVTDCNAAVLEQGGRLTRIVGPGATTTAPWEFVRTVVDLTQKQEKIAVTKAFTRDYIPLEVDLHVFYRIHVDPNALRATGKHDFQEETIRRAVLTVADWQQSVKIAAESVCREVIGMYYLGDLYDPRDAGMPQGTQSPRTRLQREIRMRLNGVVSEWGVRVDEVHIGRMEAPDEVKKTMLEKWQAEWEKQAVVSRGEGEAQVYAIRERARAQAQVQMIVGITQAFQQAKASGTTVPADLVLLRFIGAMEKLANDPATKILLSPTVFDTLQDIRQSLTPPGP